MSKKIDELLEQRVAVLKDMQKFNDDVERAERDWDSSDEEQYSNMSEKFEKLTREIERVKDLEAKSAQLDEIADEPVKPISEARTAHELRQTAEYKDAFNRWAVDGFGALNHAEQRLLQQGNAGDGGNLVPAEDFVTNLIKELDNALSIRRISTKHTLRNAVKITQPTLEADPADADWTTEVLTGSEDSTMDFGQRDLEPQPLAKRILVTRKLLANSPMPVEAIIRQRLAYKFAVTEEKAFMTGTGSGQPLGIFTASASGISTGRDVEVGSATAPTADKTKDLVYTLESKYWPNAQWQMHRDVFKVYAKLKDGDSRYLIQDDFGASERLSLMGFPLNLSEYAPNTLTANQYVCVLGDFRFYHIADALSMEMQRLVELYAATNKIGFIGRLEVDGMPVLEEAFVRGQLAAS